MRRTRKAAAPAPSRAKKSRTEAAEEAPAAAAPAPAPAPVKEQPIDDAIIAEPPKQADVYLCDAGSKQDEEGLAVLRTFIDSTTSVWIRWPDGEEPFRRAAKILLADDASIARRITHLQLKGQLDTVAVASVLAAMPKLVSLDLSFSSLPNSPAKVADMLAAVSKSGAALRDLHLSYCRLDGAMLAFSVMSYVQGCASLRRLYLEGNEITDDTAAAIVTSLIARKHPLLQLHVDSNSMSDGSHLANLIKHADALGLRTIHAFQNKFNFAAAQQIAEALAGNSSIRVLRLSHNKLGVKGCTALIQACLDRPGGAKSMAALCLLSAGLASAQRDKLAALLPSPPLEI